MIHIFSLLLAAQLQAGPVSIVLSSSGPVVSSCGLGAAYSDAPGQGSGVGFITAGAGGPFSGCTLAFSNALPETPICDALDQTSGLRLALKTSPNGFQITDSVAGGDVIKYACYLLRGN